MEILQNTISYVIYCLVMISVMILFITGSILQKYNFLCYLLFSDDFSDDFIHHWFNFYKNIISYVIYCLVMFSVMILSITGEIFQNTISYVIYF